MHEPERPSNAVPRVPLGGDYWEAEPGVPLWGFADLHAHLMAHLAFGGNAFWGEPYDPDHPGEEGLQHVMGSCEPIHGGLININPEFGHPAGGGWPDFIVWPRFTTMVHQQAYIDWLYRAYQGGLRLVTCLAVNNELLATKSNPRLPPDDRSAIQAQQGSWTHLLRQPPLPGLNVTSAPDNGFPDVSLTVPEIAPSVWSLSPVGRGPAAT